MSSSSSKTLNVSKKQGIEREGSRVRVSMKTIYYIITKMFNCQKKYFELYREK